MDKFFIFSRNTKMFANSDSIPIDQEIVSNHCQIFTGRVALIGQVATIHPSVALFNSWYQNNVTLTLEVVGTLHLIALIKAVKHQITHFRVRNALITTNKVLVSVTARLGLCYKCEVLVIHYRPDPCLVLWRQESYLGNQRTLRVGTFSKAAQVNIGLSVYIITSDIIPIRKINS